MRTALLWSLAVVAGFFLMWPLGLLFERQHWGVFHPWGLAHGSFLIAWPLFGYVVSRLLVLLPFFRERRNVP
jgi:hypothetical protein